MNTDYHSYFCLAAVCSLLCSCADKAAEDSAKPAPAQRKSFSERLSDTGGYKQDESGAWVPTSDKRSSFDSQRESKYFKGNVETKPYKTGDYAKKSWWGAKDYTKTAYQGNTDGSRFQTQARQDGNTFSESGKQARTQDPFQTNSIQREIARESSQNKISSTTHTATEQRRSNYKAPSVVGWQEQRSMDVERSRSILGR